MAEYPVGPDQRATWTHSLWYDEHYNHWTKVFEQLPLDEEFSIIKKNKRNYIFKAKTVSAFLVISILVKFSSIFIKEHRTLQSIFTVV